MGRAFCAALALFLCLISAARAAPLRADAMPVGAVTTTPIGWIMFCRENAGDCRSRASEPSGARPLTDDLIHLANDTNRAVNKAVKPMTDRSLYGVEERWTYPADRGDCEDYALEKQKILHEAGIPLSDLLITVVRQSGGEGHAVLTLRTSGGDFILDNLDRRVRAWTETRYTFVKRQSSADPNVWLTIVSGTDVAVGALKK